MKTPIPIVLIAIVLSLACSRRNRPTREGSFPEAVSPVTVHTKINGRIKMTTFDTGRTPDGRLQIKVVLQPHKVDDPTFYAFIEAAFVALDERLHQQKQHKRRHNAQRDSEYIAYDHYGYPLCFRGDRDLGKAGSARRIQHRHQFFRLGIPISLNHHPTSGIFSVNSFDVRADRGTIHPFLIDPDIPVGADRNQHAYR